MGFFQAKRRASWSRGRELERPACDVADPQGAHELQPGKPVQAVRVPFPESRIPRALTHDRVLHQGIAEMIDDGGNGECATEPFVQTCVGHRSALLARIRGWLVVPWAIDRQLRWEPAARNRDSIDTG